jgi:hypothetical protein
METHGEAAGMRYDRVVVRDGAGKRRQLSRSEFEKLPLRERVTYLIGGMAEFFAGTELIPASEAMKG